MTANTEESSINHVYFMIAKLLGAITKVVNTLNEGLQKDLGK